MFPEPGQGRAPAGDPAKPLRLNPGRFVGGKGELSGLDGGGGQIIPKNAFPAESTAPEVSLIGLDASAYSLFRCYNVNPAGNDPEGARVHAPLAGDGFRLQKASDNETAVHMDGLPTQVFIPMNFPGGDVKGLLVHFNRPFCWA